MNQYDLVVIGAGPGGYVAAIKAAQAGMAVALVEVREVGGTCLNRGCIPTKALMHSAHLYREMQESDKFGVFAKDITFDIEKMYTRKNEVVSQLRTGVEFLLKANKIDVVRGTGKVSGEGSVVVQTAEGTVDLQAKNILLATGSVPARPPIPGLDLPGVITSDELLEQSGTVYKDLVIIGGGVIGCEFATVFSALGCSVSIVEAMDRILPTMDKEISQNLAMILKRRGVAIHTSAMVEKVERGGGGLVCHFSKKEESQSVEAQAVLVSIGRRVNTEGLFTENFSVKSDRGLVVNENFETSARGIYAIGDVVSGGIQLAHMASAQGANAVAHMAGHAPEVDLRAIPSCIYTSPEIAAVGLTEAAAKEAGYEVKVGKFPMNGNGKTIIEAGE
ncbi:dihydrolipoyl dehydrogenase, partial [Clostridia bacterium OttesenSCG-928-O13]|nr:dihydrolipoyl dehydrogenase [Clostridia bacterium OttesenSCG-928-O13]